MPIDIIKSLLVSSFISAIEDLFFNLTWKGSIYMFASPARHLLIATFIGVSAFLLACSKPPEVNNNTTAQQPTPEPVVIVPPPTNVADGTQQTKTGERYEGFLDSADCNSVQGWAWNKNKPNGVEYVEIRADNIPIATPPASQARYSVAEFTKDSGYHGFTYTVHPSIKDGKPHVISARISRTDFELQGRKIIKCPPQ
jgi:hypothetical protein